MQKKLTFEKEETINGLVIYKVFLGVECLKREEENGDNADLGENGNSRAYNKTKAFYDYCIQRQKLGFPKVIVLEETVIESPSVSFPSN